jgi:hypothetical protein
LKRRVQDRARREPRRGWATAACGGRGELGSGGIRKEALEGSECGRASRNKLAQTDNVRAAPSSSPAARPASASSISRQGGAEGECRRHVPILAPADPLPSALRGIAACRRRPSCYLARRRRCAFFVGQGFDMVAK